MQKLLSQNIHWDHGLGNGEPFPRWDPVLFLTASARERSLLHPNPSPDKPAASQGRQKSILFCFHPFSQRACAELTDM